MDGVQKAKVTFDEKTGTGTATVTLSKKVDPATVAKGLSGRFSGAVAE